MTINPLIAAKPSFRAAVRRAAVAACLVAASAPAALADTSGGGEIHPPGLPCGYTVEVIERPECPGPIPAQPMWVSGLNEHGTVVGYRQQCVNSQLDQAWIWQPGDTTPTDLDLPDHVVSSQAYDINDQGVVCGAYKDNPFITAPWLGFVYDTNTGEWTELEPVIPGSAGHAYANAINNAGVVAGTRSIGNTKQPYNAFIWSADDGYTDLGVMVEPGSNGRDINDVGVVSGWTGPAASQKTRGFMWQRGSTTILEPTEEAISTIAHKINNSGIVAGGMWLDPEYSSNISQAASWAGGSWSPMSMPVGCDQAGAIVINDGNIIGGSCVGEVDEQAIAWNEDGDYLILSQAIHDSEAHHPQWVRGINNPGQILCRGNIEGQLSSIGQVLSPIESPQGDLSGDCKVDGDDLALLLSEWSKPESAADLTGDGTVGGADLGVLLSNWTTK